MSLDYPTIGVMTPLHPRFQPTLKSVWSSWYRLDYPKENLLFIFAVPQGSKNIDYIHKHFKRNYRIMELDVRVNDNIKDLDEVRFFELAEIRKQMILAVRNEVDYGWFLDGDVMVDDDALTNLLMSIIDRDMVGGLVLIPDSGHRIRMGYGYYKPHYDFAKELPDLPVVPCHSLNTACMFMSKRLMMDDSLQLNGWTPIPSKIYKGKVKGLRDGFLSEDHSFCKRAWQKGVRVALDARVRTKHVRLWNNGVQTYDSHKVKSNGKKYVSV